MMDVPETYRGRWLHSDEWHGKEFSHELPEYQHAPGESSGAVAMRHATVEQNGNAVSVWVPAHWSDEETKQALDTNW